MNDFERQKELEEQEMDEAIRLAVELEEHPGLEAILDQIEYLEDR
jgi:hypothetical protein